MSVLALNDVTLAFGHKLLLDRANLQIDSGERVCLVGRNGTGKSTLLKVLRGSLAPDDGTVSRQDTLKIAHLEQDVPQDLSATVYQTVAAGLPELGQVLADYHDASHAAGNDAASLQRLAALHQRIDDLDGWNFSQKVEEVLSRLALPPDQIVSACSGGIRRRVMLGQALVSDPDVLLLDEPTNHMDIDGITALEEMLLAFQGATVFITHDRTLIRRLATRIIELDRGQLVSFPGNYDEYLVRKERMLDTESREHAAFDKFLAEEEVWIRQGIKARRTRNEGRVRRLEALRDERRQRTERHGNVRFEVDSSARSGQIVADLDRVNFGYPGQPPLVRDLTMTVRRGDRIGIIGPNGCGKSTLLRLMLGELAPSTGEIRLGTQLKTAYFDQQRAQLDPDKTVRQNVSEGSDQVTIGGRSRHVIGYLGDFLFPPERTNSPVASLSGGERNRLLMAKLFTQPANLLVLDEPTNDLDAETLELLEELLAEFTGTLLLVSHDRAFIDNVVTSIVAFEGDGAWGEYVGGYQDWLRQNRARRQAPAPRPDTERAVAANERRPSQKRLSYKEQRELDAMPQTIDALEAEHRDIQRRIAADAFYRQDKAAITATLASLDRASERLAAAYARWEQLERSS